jgi:hypothetical protein
LHIRARIADSIAYPILKRQLWKESIPLNKERHGTQSSMSGDMFLKHVRKQAKAKMLQAISGRFFQGSCGGTNLCINVE